MEKYSYDPTATEISPYAGRVPYAEFQRVHDIASQWRMGPLGSVESQEPIAETTEDSESVVADMLPEQMGGMVLRIAQGVSYEADDIVHRVFHDGLPHQMFADSVATVPELDQQPTETADRAASFRLAEIADLHQRRQNFAVQLGEIARHQAA